MEAHGLKSQQLTKEASDWFALLADPAVTAADRESFDAWLLRSPAHIEAYLRVSRAWGDLGLAFSEAPSVETLIAAAAARDDVDKNNVVAHPREASIRNVPPRHRRHTFVYAVAASVAAAVVTSLGWLLADRWLGSSRMTTAIGEQRSITLADGSVVDLNTDSEARVIFTERERRVTLVRGEARFAVVKDPTRVFSVDTRQATVRALGTVFNVRAIDGQTAVTVLEGRVALASSPGEPRTGVSDHQEQIPRTQALELGVNQQASVTNKGQILKNTGPSAEQARAWSKRQLIFRGQPLAEVIAEFNRYHADPVRIAGDELATLKINGVFDANDSASLIEYLQKYRNVRSERQRDGGQILLLDQ